METTETHWLELPTAPAITGLRFRWYADEHDLAGMAGVMRAANAANGQSEHITEEYLRSQVVNYSHIPPETSWLLAFIDERIVACSWLEYSDTTEGRRNYSVYGHVDPRWRRRGIGSAMAAHNEAVLLDMAAQQRHPGGAALTTWIEEADAGGMALMQARGYRESRVGFHMVRSSLDAIEVPPMPVGLDVRPVTSDDLPRLWEAMIEAFQDHFGGHDGSEAAYQRWVSDPIFEMSLLLVGFDGKQVAGGVQGWVDPDENEANGYRRGWTDPVFTCRRWRRRGLAGALLARTLVALRDRGMTSAQLDVDATNPHQALTLYERHGFETTHRAFEWTKEVKPWA